MTHVTAINTDLSLSSSSASEKYFLKILIFYLSSGSIISKTRLEGCYNHCGEGYQVSGIFLQKNIKPLSLSLSIFSTIKSDCVRIKLYIPIYPRIILWLGKFLTGGGVPTFKLGFSATVIITIIFFISDSGVSSVQTEVKNLFKKCLHQKSLLSSKFLLPF